MDDRSIFDRLLLILPDLAFDEKFMNLAVKQGLLNKVDQQAWREATGLVGRGKRIISNMQGKDPVRAIMSLAPELMSVQTVNLMRKVGLVDVNEAHKLRIALGAAKKLNAAAVTEKTIFGRLEKVIGSAANTEVINLVRRMDDAKISSIRNMLLKESGKKRLSPAEAAELRDMMESSLTRANTLRGILSGGKVLEESYEGMLKQWAKNKSVFDAVFVGMSGVFGDDMLKAMIKAGVIPPNYYDTIRAIEKVGLNVWSKAVKATDYDGWWARSLMVSQGILSPETVSAARQLGLINERQAQALYGAVNLSRSMARGLMDANLSSRKYRVNPRETPIQTFSRISRMTDENLLQLLKEASKRSSRAADELAKTRKFGSATRAAQQKMLAKEMNDEMRRLSESMGHLIMFGEREAALAAITAEEWMQKELFKKMGSDVSRSLKYSARAGMDSFVSREENKRRLSRLVYGNFNVWSGRIGREVSIGLLRGLSAKELAKSIEGMIDPAVRGGVSYAAMRLARTEINNAFHQTAIRYTREMPWVEGYQWHLSGSHPKADICNDMAGKDHAGMGKGVYKKKDVPGKPHPHCYCYITTVTKSPGEFEKQLKRGSYKRYLDSQRYDSPFSSSGVSEYQSNFAQVAKPVWNQFVPAFVDFAFQTAVTNPGLVRHAFHRMFGDDLDDFGGRVVSPGTPGLGPAGRKRIGPAPTRAEIEVGPLGNIQSAGLWDDWVSAGDDLIGGMGTSIPWGFVDDQALLLARNSMTGEQFLANGMYAGNWSYVNINGWLRANPGKTIEDMVQEGRNAAEFSAKNGKMVWTPDDLMDYYRYMETGERGSLSTAVMKGISAEMDEIVDEMSKTMRGMGMTEEQIQGRFRTEDGKYLPSLTANLIRKLVRELEVDEGDLNHLTKNYAPGQVYAEAMRQTIGSSDYGATLGFLNSKKSFTQFYADGMKEFGKTQKTKNKSNAYRMSRADWMGGPLTDKDGVGRIFTDDAFVSAQNTPDDYFSAVLRGRDPFGNGKKMDHAFRIFTPEGSSWSTGAIAESEMVFPPGSRFQVLGYKDVKMDNSAILNELKEEGLTLKDLREMDPADLSGMGWFPEEVERLLNAPKIRVVELLLLPPKRRK